MSAGNFSLARRLALRLGLLFLLATAGATGAVWLSGTLFTEALQNRALEEQAAVIAAAIVTESGRPRLDTSSELLATYADGNLTVVVRDAAGGVIAAIPADAAVQPGKWAPPAQSPDYFEIEPENGDPERYGISVRHDTQAGPVWISVTEGRAAGDALVRSMLAEFYAHTWWVVLPFVVLVLIVGQWTLSAGLSSMRTLSQRAARIGPRASEERLPTGQVPAEVRPLVDAVNGAFDRLELALRLQREFTANAAHQLRTPLAILTARLDGLDATEKSAVLRRDVERINRLVHQLLKVARLDAQPLDVSQPVDLRAVASESVSYAAPLAIKRKRELALVGAEGPVWVRGNAQAIGDALVNLIENAIAHAPEGSTIAVAVAADGTLSVSDRGPGIPVGQREEAMRRFWRGKAAKGDGAGLGLAIVAETARQHGGSLRIEDNPGGGARIVLNFVAAAPPGDAVAPERRGLVTESADRL